VNSLAPEVCAETLLSDEKRNVRIFHVTSWLTRQGGGIPPVIWSLTREFRELGMKAFVAGLRDEFLGADCGHDEVLFVAGKVLGPGSFGYSRELGDTLSGRLGSNSVVHSHGLWMHSGVAARNASINANVPLIISPHGMLEPWALANSKWKKCMAANLFENRNLRSAQCLHALCEAEAENFRAYGLKNPIAIIPNGIEPAEFNAMPAYEQIESVHPSFKNKRRLLFLSRIHPKKGLEHLLQGWRKVVADFPNWQLVIAGGGEAQHEAHTRALVKKLGLDGNVTFPGPVYGEEKRIALGGADAFVLPSFSEGFSIAILEAAASGLPVLITPQCNFPELVSAGGGFEMEPNVAGCESGLRQLLSLLPEQRKEMGRKARNLIHVNYTWRRVARKMLEVYCWLLNQGPRPGFVFTD